MTKVDELSKPNKSEDDKWQQIYQQTQQINQQLDKLNNHKLIKTYDSMPRLLWFSLLKGVALGLGSVLGATVVLSTILYLLSQIEFVPIIGDIVSKIIEVVEVPPKN